MAEPDHGRRQDGHEERKAETAEPVARGDGEPDLAAQGLLLAHDAEEQEAHAHGRDRQEVMAYP